MTPAERNLHDIAATFTGTPARVEIVYERCGVCGGSGRVAISRWSHPQMHTERCVTCAGRGQIARQVSP